MHNHSSTAAQQDHKKTYVALGSNIGDRVTNIEAACREMARAGIRVLRTSSLYETKAMYLESQAPFINGVCEVSFAVILF
jgi:2-amino-4-hydroxy-6-hydroxymethyldihydropteridine diphosphokinase/dihydropteroate synthase